MDRVAVRVGEDLCLNVTRPTHGLLNVGRRVAKCALGLPHSGTDSFSQLLGVTDPAHASATAASDSLHKNREADRFGPSDELVHIRRWRRRLERWNTCSPGRLNSADLVAGKFEHLRWRADEGNADICTRARQLRVLAEEAVARIDRIGIGLLGGTHDLVDVQVGPYRVSTFTDQIRLVRLDPVDGVSVLVWEYRHRPYAQLVCRAKGPYCDLTAISDQYLAEHGSNLAADCYRSETVPNGHPGQWASEPNRNRG